MHALMLLAQAEPAGPALWQVVTALSSLLALGIAAMTFSRMANGKAGERQVEPTQNHAMMAELKTQTDMLSTIRVDVGVVKKGLELQELQMTGMHSRVGAISRDLASTTTRVDGLEKREGQRRA